MTKSVRDVDAQRARWISYRQERALVRPDDEDFARGGFGRLIKELDVRFLFLPSDPRADVVPFDNETREWLAAERTSPFGGRPPDWGYRTRATSEALVRYSPDKEDRGWERYLALGRHGGVEFGSSTLANRQPERIRVFPLRRIVGLAWSALAVQAEVIEQWSPPGPFELTVALRGTRDAILGQVAEGWAEPSKEPYDVARCVEDHVLLRWEFDDFPPVEDVALDIGDRIEQTFGTTHRRYLARQGRYEGKFDPR